MGFGTTEIMGESSLTLWYWAEPCKESWEGGPELTQCRVAQSGSGETQGRVSETRPLTAVGQGRCFGGRGGRGLVLEKANPGDQSCWLQEEGWGVV